MLNLKNMKKYSCLGFQITTLAVCFFTSFAPAAFSENQPAATNKLNLPPDISEIKIPQEVGRIMEYHAGSKPFTIFYIQDAHVNVEAQKCIAKIIETLHLKKDVRLILVEGGIGDVSLTEYRVGEKEKRKGIAERLLKEGKISGEEYLNFVEEYPLLLWGIESQVLYDENLIAYTKVEPLIPKTLDQLKQVRESISKLKPLLYPKEYFTFENQLSELAAKKDLSGEAKLLLDFAKKKNIEISVYPNLQSLSKLIQLESGADFEKVDYERTQLVKKLQRSAPIKELQAVLEFEKGTDKDALKRADFYEKLIALAEKFKVELTPFPSLKSAIPYLREQQNIDSIAFFSEKEKLESEIASSYLADEKPKKLYQMSRDVSLLESLVKLEMLPENYKEFMDDRNRFKLALWSAFLTEQAKANQVSISLPSELEKLDDQIDQFQSFYRIANIRDQAMVENLTQKVSDERQAEAVLIAGGFHKDRLIRKMLRIGFSVVVISPNVDVTQGQELYRKMLTEKWENGRWFIKDDKQPAEEKNTS